MTNVRFENLNISEEMKKAIKDMGFEEATPIQSQAIPLVLEGEDIVGLAQTGTGKTAAFGVATLDKIDKAIKGVQLMVLCPTRELALQVSEEFEKLCKYKKEVKIISVYGGDPISRQIRALKQGANVVIGTPGRVMDHMRRGSLKLDKLNTLILDEADEMLNMGFREDIETIIGSIEHDIQKLLFSATMKKNIMEIVDTYLKNPKKVQIKSKEVTTPNITQKYICIKESDKEEALCRIIDFKNPKVTLTFCNTKRKVDELFDSLQQKGYLCEKIHGDMKQNVRNTVITKVKKGDIKVLIATDVAARGLDIDDVDMVFNYDVPTHEEYYVHRIGRTGRAGREGTSITLVSRREMRILKDIMRYTKKQMEEEKIPSAKDIENLKLQEYMNKVKEKCNSKVTKRHSTIIDGLIEEGYSIIDLLAAMIDLEVNIGDIKEIVAEKEEKSSNRKKSTNKGMKRFFINIGRNKKVKPEDILKALVTGTDIKGKDIGTIDMYDKFSFVEVSDKFANDVLNKASKNKIRGMRINIEVAGKKK